MDRFPLPATAEYRYEQRFGSTHEGTDILAPAGTPVLAVVAGKAWRTLDDKGGRVVYLQSASGIYAETYYFAHLSDWDSRLRDAVHPDNAQRVAAGETLGFVGTTGNAKGGPPHLHLQLRRGSLVIDPFDDLQAVDPHRERGTRSRAGSGSPSAAGAALLVLGILFLLSKRGHA